MASQSHRVRKMIDGGGDGRWTDNAGRVAGRLLFSFNVLLLISNKVGRESKNSIVP